MSITYVKIICNQCTWMDKLWGNVGNIHTVYIHRQIVWDTKVINAKMNLVLLSSTWAKLWLFGITVISTTRVALKYHSDSHVINGIV